MQRPAKTRHEICENHVRGVIFHHFRGVWEPLGPILGKGSKKVAKVDSALFTFGGHFRQFLRRKCQRKKICFWDPLFSTKNGSRPPQKVYSGRSGSQKASKMEPKSNTFGDLWKRSFCCYLLGLDYFRGSQNDSKMGLFSGGLLGA